ncbi:GDP-L-galactose phosphorylase [Musa troglodytarum]|uniref:GDP-L-galactose phosphorylase n=1 Tax=Musa troglodytarum TaxID=320322 RepID=A0A9E7K9Y9_9LILI|nr:GDP-L-galactose phosphorylase [Musa troglodytarum]
MSVYQPTEGQHGEEKSGRNCVLQGIGLPLYYFSKAEKDSGCSSEKIEPQSTFLDRLLKEWDDRKVRGLFHHDVNAYETKILSGDYGFILQLIEGRDLKKRPTEFRIDRVLQPFDGKKFNFTKIAQAEMLFRFEESENDESGFFENTPIAASESPNVIAINVSPIGYGHVLLIPRILDCLPQRLDEQSLLLALYVAREAETPYFRVAYNSLGAFATINHLHFQVFYLVGVFPVEKAPTQRIMTLASGVEIFQLSHYPVRGLVFGGGSNLEDLSIAVSIACIFLQDNDIPYNVIISDAGKQIFLLLQCYAEKRTRGEVNQEFLEMQINPAAWELGGYMVVKRRKDYQETSEDTLWRFLDEEASVSAERFKEINDCILSTLSDKIVERNMKREDDHKC